MKTLNTEQIKTHGPQTESQPTPTSTEASATQTSFNEDQILTQVVANINAETEDEIADNGGGKMAKKPKVSCKTFFLRDMGW